MKKLISLFLAVLFLLGTVTVVNAEGEPFKGVVIDETADTLTVMNEFGTLLTFVPGEGLEMPALGSTVTVDYSGDLTTQLVADAVTVDAAPVALTANVTVAAIGENVFTATLEDGTQKEFRFNETTAITGKAAALEAGQKVTVTYVETAYSAVAQQIEIAEPVVVVEPVEDVTNKTLSGKVTKLTDSKITIKTKKGKSWTFKYSKKSKVSGKYDLKVGCTVTITYDGYASKNPLAKKIKVTKAAANYKTMSGTCSQYLKDDCMLLKNGHYFYIKGAKMTGKGNPGVGTKCTITYYVKNGEKYAVKINWKPAPTK